MSDADSAIRVAEYDNERIRDEAVALLAKPDGFRPRRKRPKGWLAGAIKRGEVADPAKGPQPPQDYPAETHVIDVPMADAAGMGREE